MELGIPTPASKQIWKVNEELFVVATITDGVSILKSFKPTSLKCSSAATIKFLALPKKTSTTIKNRSRLILDAIDLGTTSLKNIEKLSREKQLRLPK
uniref:DUF1758 domain-containing protein n=1 Tax=Strongyloides papillosus TaxID=174720 RepID=A0A0N5CAE3_STREA